jgi:regulator of replication initiation timing
MGSNLVYPFKRKSLPGGRVHSVHPNYDRIHPISIPSSLEEKSDQPNRSFSGPSRSLTIGDVLRELKGIVQPLQEEVSALRKVTVDLQRQVKILQDENHKMRSELSNVPSVHSLQREESKNAAYIFAASRGMLKEEVEMDSVNQAELSELTPPVMPLTLSRSVSDVESLGTVIRQQSTETDCSANTASLFMSVPLPPLTKERTDLSKWSGGTMSGAPSPRNLERLERMDQLIANSMRQYHAEEDPMNSNCVTFRGDHRCRYSEQLDISMDDIYSSNEDLETHSNVLKHYDGAGMLSDSTATTPNSNHHDLLRQNSGSKQSSRI